MGRAINKTVTVAEIIKRRIPRLHQLTEIGSVNVTDTWEPLEEGLSILETTRHVSVISITLSTVELDTSKPGYQPPLPEDQVKPLQEGPPLRSQAARGSVPRGRYTLCTCSTIKMACKQRTCSSLYMPPLNAAGEQGQGVVEAKSWTLVHQARQKLSHN